MNKYNVVTYMQKFTDQFTKQIICQAEHVGDLFIDSLNSLSISYDSFPVYTKNGSWNFSKHWSNGFLSGYFSKLYELTNSDKWLYYSDKTAEVLSDLLDNKDRFQDVGYIFYFSNDGINCRVNLVLQAADYLLDCMENEGHLFVNWKKDSNYMGIDQLANMSLFVLAYELTGHNKYYKACEKIILTSLTYLIREDGFSYEYIDVKKLYSPANKNAPDNNSIWIRGHMWAIYGLSLAYSKLNIDCYNILEKLCLVIINIYRKKPFCWCFNSKDYPDLRDTSAGAICLSAISDKKILGESAIIDELHTLLIQHFASLNVVNTDRNHQALLKDVSSPTNIINSSGESAMWGECFFLEAVIKNC
jgi:hypothetical protein